MKKPLKIGCLIIVILILLGLAWTAGFGSGLFAGVSAEATDSRLHKTVLSGRGDHQIALLALDGLILSSPSPNLFTLTQGTITPEAVARTLQLALADPAIKALIINLNSPGGSAVAADQIYQSIKATAKEKPIIFLLRDTAASGGYFIATAGSYIFANPATLTGSIGAIAQVTDLQELFKKIGLEQETYKSGEFKDLFSGTRDRTPEEQKMIQELLDTTYELFLKRVAEGREMELDQLRPLAQGQVYSGEKALELGLIDGLGYQNDAFEKAKELARIEEATLVSITTKSLFQQLFSEIKSSNPLSALLPQLFLSQSGVKYLYK